ncbi:MULTISPECIES: hypothetical protein [Bacillus]|nr:MULTISPECIES: hypothetical protein [Bacillus]EOP16266.1 hypothetical protein IIS_06154 [Bacillus cereus VD131]KAF6544882.1 hypothetical protein G9F74_28665 [Bacillus sp. EKM202B]MCU5726532.1 hypothetical protein [Bacillus toyonensis]MDD9265287.1 hypothetical protein [Bacillus toyonensis]TBX40601.1 hypothetical protein E0M44_26040 [Bacillus toyonensis]
MNNVDYLIEISADQWLNVLPQYQKRIVTRLIEKNEDVEIAAIQYLNLGISDTAPFSASGTKNIFIDKIKLEFERFLCGDQKYENERQKLSAELKPGHTLIVSTLSSAISVYVGASAAYLAPIIVLLLMSVGKVSINAWCEICMEKRKNVSSEL